MFSYRALFKQAWEITWKHKYLWFLGLFAALVVGGGPWEYQVMAQNLNQSIVDGSFYRLNDILAAQAALANFGQGLVNLFHYDALTIINVLLLLLVILALLAFLIWLAVTCQAALIGDVQKISVSKKKEQTLSLRNSLTAGHKHFWSVLSLNLAIKLVIGLVFFIVSLPLLFMAIKDTTALVIIYTILFVILVPISVSLSLMTNYVIAYRVLDNKTFVASLEHGGKLFADNWLVSLEFGLILFLINFAASAIVLVIMALFLLPLLLLGLLLNAAWLSGLIIGLAIILVVLFGAGLTTFEMSAWTLLFLRLKESGVLAKLERLFGH